MIITGLLTIIYGVLSVLLVFGLPSIPLTITSVLDTLFAYMVSGVGILRLFIGSTAMGVIALLLTLVLAMNAVYFLWSFVFWVIRKVPMLNVKE